MDDLLFAIKTINKLKDNNLALEIYYSDELDFCVKIYDLRKEVAHSLIVYQYNEDLEVACKKAIKKLSKKVAKGELVG